MRAVEDSFTQLHDVPYEGELRFRRLVDTLSAAAYTCDRDGRITYFNREAARVWGREPAMNDAMERFCCSVKLYYLDGSPMRHDECWMARALKEGKGFNGKEVVVERPDGWRLTGLAYANPIRDASGEIVGAVNVLVDITEQKQTEALVAGQTRVLEMLATGAPLNDVLASVVRLIEAQSDGILGSILVRRNGGDRFQACIAPSLPESLCDALVEAAISPPYFGPCSRAAHLGQEVAIDDIAGDPRWSEPWRDLVLGTDLRACYAAPIFASDGSVLGAFGMYQREPSDAKPSNPQLLEVATYLSGIAIESKRAEHALRENEAKLALAVDIAQLGHWELDLSTRTLTASAHCKANFGRRADEPFGFDDLRASVHPDDRSRLKAVLARAIESRSELDVEYRAYTPEGAVRWIEVRGRFEESETGAPKLVGVTLDRTSRKRAEERLRRQELEWALERQMDEERRRVGRELHDGFRQQLLGIGMLSSTLATKLRDRGAPEAELMQEFSKLLGDANSHLRGLIHNLTPVKVDAEGLVPALQRACTYIEQWYGVPCLVHFPRTDLDLANDVANHLFHIAQEAMTNAARHSNAPRVEVFLRTEGAAFILEVRDEGDGLPADYDEMGGVGVTSMRHRAELIGASLTIVGNGGTTLTCRLPAS